MRLRLRRLKAVPIEVQEGECRGQGDPLVAIEKAVVLDQTVGVAGGQLEEARRLIGVGKEVLGPGQSGVEETRITHALSTAVRGDEHAVDCEDGRLEEPFRLGRHFASSRRTSLCSRITRPAAWIWRTNRSSGVSW